MVFPVSMNLDSDVVSDFGVSTEDAAVLPTRGFGMLEGGTVDIKFSYSYIQFPIAIMILNDVQMQDYDTLVNLIESNSDLDPSWCTLPSLYRKQLYMKTNATSNVEFSYKYTVPATDRYHVIMTNCDRGFLSMQGNIQFLNPGTQLSYEQLSLKKVYQLAIAVDAIILSIWFAYLYHMKANIRQIHIILSCVSVFKILYEALLLGYLANISSTGTEARPLL
jgi:hypothetical protein